MTATGLRVKTSFYAKNESTCVTEVFDKLLHRYFHSCLVITKPHLQKGKNGHHCWIINAVFEIINKCLIFMGCDGQQRK